MTALPVVSVVTPAPPRNVLTRYTEDVVTEVLSQRRTQSSTSLPHITAAVENAASKVELEQTLADFEQLRRVLAAEGPVPQYSSRRFMRLRLDWPELWEALRKISTAVLFITLMAACTVPTQPRLQAPDCRHCKDPMYVPGTLLKRW